MDNEKIAGNQPEVQLEKQSEKQPEQSSEKSSARPRGRGGRRSGNRRDRSENASRSAGAERSEVANRPDKETRPDVAPRSEMAARPNVAARRDAAARPNAAGRSGRPETSTRSARPSDAAGRSGRSNRFETPARPARSGDQSASSSGDRWTSRIYILQLSVVILGVMVTFIGSGLVEGWRANREVRTVMQLMVEELKTNRVQLEKVSKKLRFDRNGMLMYQRYDMDLKRIPQDSLDYYATIIGATESLHPQVDALEVLKSSGAISSIDDKRLLFDLLRCYNNMQNFGVNVATYNDRKMAALDHLFANSSDFSITTTNSHQAWSAYSKDPMCAAFLGCMAYYFGYEDTFDDFLTELDNTVAAINKEYGLE